MRIRFVPSAFLPIPVAALTLLALLCCGSCSSSDAVRPSVTLSIVDRHNSRVLIFDSPFSSGESATTVLGQADFTDSVLATTASGLNVPWGVATDAQDNIWVSDAQNNRVLRYRPPFTNGMAAKLVLGQTNFTTGDYSASISGMNLPFGLAFDKNGNLWVSDTRNVRVLEFSPPFRSGMAASLVLGGQSGFNGIGLCSVIPSASSFCDPTDLAFDADGNLWIPDYFYNRVLEFKPPFVNGQSASIVLGQQDFASRIGAAGAAGLDIPTGIAFDKAGNLWVSDYRNRRVLKFSAPFSNGQPASLVLGCPDLKAPAIANFQICILSPQGLTFDDAGNLFVVDSGASRVLMFQPPFSDGMNATGVIGQPNFTTVPIHGTKYPPTASGLGFPSNLSFSH
jgi:DNA-binding beta-propeller fold protein YncE